MGENIIDTVIQEGRAKLFIPDLKKFVRPDGKIEPAWSPVFYNPYAKENRDLTVLGIKSYNSLKKENTKTFVEPLSGSCIRSIRVLLEALETEEAKAYASDISRTAVDYCMKNIEANSLGDKLKVSLEDANIFMLKLDKEGVPVDIVDIDPFGSPIYYIQSAIRLLGKGGLLFATATDLAPLSGKYENVALRRYGVRIKKTYYSKELAARTLIGSIARIAAMLDRGVKPLYTYYHEHYLKVTLEVTHGKNDANQSMSKIGFICAEHPFYPEDSFYLKNTWYNECREPIGPIWLDELWNKEFADKIYNLAIEDKNLSESFIRKLDIIRREAVIPVPFYYRLDKLCSLVKRDIPSFNSFIESLREAGYLAERTHFDPRSIRTDAPFNELLSLLRKT